MMRGIKRVTLGCNKTAGNFKKKKGVGDFLPVFFPP